jgi:lipoprotein NlpI
MERSNKAKYYLAGLIALITFAVYLHALQNDFVVLDDDAYIFDNLHIRSFNLPFLRWAFLGFYASNWHPLTWMSHAMDYALWGLNPLGHHLTNIILHAVNTFIVVILAMRLREALTWTTEQTKPTTFLHEQTVLITGVVTGMLFGLHPLHVESVAWVAERKDLLCALFFLLSILSYANFARGQGSGARGQELGAGRQKTEDRKKTAEGGENAKSGPKKIFINKHYLLSLVLFVLALMSKPMAVTLPVVLLILDWYPFNRIHSLKTFRSALVEKLPFMALSLMSSILTLLAQGAGRAIVPITFVPVPVRLLVAARSLIAYLWKMAVPVNLVPFYPYPENASLLSGKYLLAVACVVAITVTCLVLAKKQKLWLSGWGYFVITLVPVIGIVQVGGQAMADRYTYLPSLGPLLIVGCAVAWLFDRMNTTKKRWIHAANIIGVAAIVLTSVLMAYLTFQQIGVWKNSLVVLNYILDKEPHKSPQVYLYRGIALEKSGQPERALEDYNRAIALDPSYSEAYDSRGVLYQKKGLVDKAIDDFNRSIVLDPSSGKAYFNRGFIHAETGMFDQAIKDFNHALAIEPSFADAYANRGIAYALSGRQGLALADFNKAIELNERSADAYFDRGKLYYASGQKERAREDFQKSCDLGDASGCGALQDMSKESMVPGK